MTTEFKYVLKGVILLILTGMSGFLTAAVSDEILLMVLGMFVTVALGSTAVKVCIRFNRHVGK